MSTISATQVVVLVCFMGSIFASGLVLYAMIGQVNRKLPDDQQIEYLFMYPGKVGKIISKHRRLYPTGRLPFLWYLTVGAMIALALALAWSIGFFR